MVAEGEAAGLRPLWLQPQSRFLQSLGLDGWLRRLRAERLPQREHDANMMAMRDLVRQDRLGAFKVLVQEKGTGVSDPGQLASDLSLAADLSLPLLRPEHIRLLEGRYPYVAWGVEAVESKGTEDAALVRRIR